MQSSRPARRDRFTIATTPGVLAAAALLVTLTGSAQAAGALRSVSFEIKAPAADSTVSSPVQLEVALTGATIGRPSAGLDHLHVSVDGGPEQAIYQPGPVTLNLAPGKHLVFVEVAGPNHRALLPARHVSFTVK